MPSPSAPRTRQGWVLARADSSSARRFAIKADAPEAGFADFIERAGEIDDAAPWQGFERTRCRAGEHAQFARRVAVLRHQRAGAKGRGPAHDRADIVRIGDLIEDDDRAVFAIARRFGEDIAEPDQFERFDFEHEALVRRIGGHQPAQIMIIAILDVEAPGDDDGLGGVPASDTACGTGVPDYRARQTPRGGRTGAGMCSSAHDFS